MKTNKFSLYVKAIFKNCNVVAYAVVGILAVLFAYLFESFNVLDYFNGLQTINIIGYLSPALNTMRYSQVTQLG